MPYKSGEQVLQRLGTTLKQLLHNPSMFLNMLESMQDLPQQLTYAQLQSSLIVKRTSPSVWVDEVSLGILAEYPEGQAIPVTHVGCVVGCLSFPGSVQDLILLVDTGRSSSKSSGKEPVQPLKIDIVNAQNVFPILQPAADLELEVPRRKIITKSKPSTQPMYSFLALAKGNILQITDHMEDPKIVYYKSTDEDLYIHSIAFDVKTNIAAMLDDQSNLILYNTSIGEVISIVTLSMSHFQPQSETIKRHLKKITFGIGYLMDGKETILYGLLQEENQEEKQIICYLCWIDKKSGVVVPLLKLQPDVKVNNFAVVPFAERSKFSEIEKLEPTFVIHVEEKGLFVVNSSEFKELKLKSTDHLFVAQIQDVAFSTNAELFITTFRSLMYANKENTVSKVKYLGSVVESLSPIQNDVTINFDKFRDVYIGEEMILEELSEDTEDEAFLSQEDEVVHQTSPTMQKLLQKMSGWPLFSKRKQHTSEHQFDDSFKDDAEEIDAMPPPPPDTNSSNSRLINREHYLSHEFAIVLSDLLNDTIHEEFWSASPENRTSSLAVGSQKYGARSGSLHHSVENRELTSNYTNEQMVLKHPRNSLSRNNPIRSSSLAQMRPKSSDSFSQQSSSFAMVQRPISTDIRSVLESINLERYLNRFIEEELTDVSVLQSLAKDHELKDILKEIGVEKLGHRAKIMQALINL